MEDMLNCGPGQSNNCEYKSVEQLVRESERLAVIKAYVNSTNKRRN